MKLSDAASFFDRVEALDASTGKLLFRCQIDNYDDSRRDAGPAYRRVMSVKPGTKIPASRVVKFFDSVWIVGSKETDALDELHRDKYVVQRAQAHLKISRLDGFLTGLVASQHYAAPMWVKDSGQLETSSLKPQLYQVFLPQAADVRELDVLWDASGAYLVVAPHLSASDFCTADAVQLGVAAPVSCQVVNRLYDPVTGLYIESDPATVSVLPVRWQDLFVYESEASEKYRPGDLTIVVPPSLAPTTGTAVTVYGTKYQTVDVLLLLGYTLLHARPL